MFSIPKLDNFVPWYSSKLMIYWCRRLPIICKSFSEALRNRFIFGKWVEPRSSVTFAGRTLEIRLDHIGVHFEKYVREELKLAPIQKGRLSHKGEPTTEAEQVSLRTTVYQLNWLGKE